MFVLIGIKCIYGMYIFVEYTSINIIRFLYYLSLFRLLMTTSSSLYSELLDGELIRASDSANDRPHVFIFKAVEKN